VPSRVPVDKKGKCVGGATSGSSRNLWVSGLSSSTRATDLKQVFSKYGKVRTGLQVQMGPLTYMAR
jgi:RNA recognition motif-containing protein